MLVRRALIAAGVLLCGFMLFELAYERTGAFRNGNRLYYRNGRADGGRAWLWRRVLVS